MPTKNLSGKHSCPHSATPHSKGSYSLTADSGPDYVSNATAIFNPYTPGARSAPSRNSVSSLESIANGELTYEKKHELNLGVDLGFFNNRINVVFDWYRRNNYDLIGTIFTQGVGGENQKYANVAEMASHGVEFTVSTRNFQGRDFSWSTDLTFAYAKTRLPTSTLSRV